LLINSLLLVMAVSRTWEKISVPEKYLREAESAAELLAASETPVARSPSLEALAGDLQEVGEIVEEEDPKCGCKKNWIDERCIHKAITSWMPEEEALICNGCFFDMGNQMNHECVSWNLTDGEREQFLVDTAWSTMLHPGNLSEIFNEYVKSHPGTGHLIIKFEYGVRTILKRKVWELLDELLEKDREAGYRYRRNLRFK